MLVALVEDVVAEMSASESSLISIFAKGRFAGNDFMLVRLVRRFARAHSIDL
jgi:hypothetical protein